MKLLPVILCCLAVGCIEMEKGYNKAITPKIAVSNHLTQGSLKVVVAPINGGRIASFTHNDVEILSGKDVHPDNWGSTFWSSPQSQWGWPPPESFDQTPYEISNKNGVIRLKGENAEELGYGFEKSLVMSTYAGLDALAITYTITNNSEETKQVAPWEITRVAPQGITLYPGIADSFTSPFPVDAKNDVIWLDYSTSPVQEGHSKLIGDATEGWIAHVNEGKIFIKIFENLEPTAFAPEEGEVEIYRHPDGGYVEIEVQGRYEALDPGQSTNYNVTWLVIDLPADIPVAVGSKKLVSFIEATLKN